MVPASALPTAEPRLLLLVLALLSFPVGSEQERRRPPSRLCTYLFIRVPQPWNVLRFILDCSLSLF